MIVRVDFSSVRAPEKRAGDVVRVSHASSAPATPQRRARGHLYVVPGHEDDPYEVWRVGEREVVLRGVRSTSSFLYLRGEPLGPEYGFWVTREQWERRDEWRLAPATP